MRLNLARIFQVAIICLTIGVFIVSIPINYAQRSIVCQAQPCPPEQLAPGSEQALNQIGLSVKSFVILAIGLDILVAFTYTVCAIVIFVRKPNDLFTIFVTVMLVTFGAGTFTGAIKGFTISYPQMGWLITTIGLIGNCAILAFLFIFPNGRFTPPWTIYILAIYFLLQLPRYYAPQSTLNLANSSPLLYNLLFAAINLSGISTQVYRYRRISNSIEKQQIKWVVYGMAIGIGGYMIIRLLSILIRDPNGINLQITIGFNIFAILFYLLPSTIINESQLKGLQILLRVFQ